MLFSVEHDTGSSIRFYLIPDAAGATPSVRITGGGRELAVVAATDVRPEILASGRHATGRCGFLVEEATVPGLAGYADLEIAEAASGLRVYRRRLPRHIEAKVFRLETHLLRLRHFDNALADSFQYWYSGIDSHGAETSHQVFHIHRLESAYISGRMLLSRVQADLNNGYRVTAMLRDPFDELAERLIVLKNVGPQAADLLGARDALSFEPVMDALAEVDGFDRASLRRFFRRAGRDVAAILGNPLCRQLTADSMEESLNKSCLSRALQALSSFEVIGLRSDPAGYAQAVAETLGLDSAVPAVAESAPVVELGNVLRDSKEAEAILEQDLELFEHTSHAFGTLAAHGA